MSISAQRKNTIEYILSYSLSRERVVYCLLSIKVTFMYQDVSQKHSGGLRWDYD